MTTLPRPKRPVMVGDEIDPAPRILELIAACLDEPWKNPLSQRLRAAVDILNGNQPTVDLRGTTLARVMLAQRRVHCPVDPLFQRRDRKIKPKRVTRMSADDERHYRQAVESGHLKPKETL